MTTRRFAAIVFALSALGVAAAASFPQVHAQTPEVVAIKGATILTATRGTIPNGTIVLRGGKIAAVGANVPVASDWAISLTGERGPSSSGEPGA